MHGTQQQGADLAALAARDDFRLGGVAISPSTRRLVGPGGEAIVEPRVMQVLLALADSGGAVVTRAALLRDCWGGQIVGDDAVNRAVGEVRRLGRTVAAGGFAVETIKKTGWRLLAEAEAPATVPADEPPNTAPAAAKRPDWTRRALLGGGALAAAGLAVAWRSLPGGDEARAAALVQDGARTLRLGLPDSAEQGVGLLREAVALAPGDAGAWGLLALAWRGVAEHAPPAETAAAVAAADAAADRALALDPRQGDALATRALLPPTFGDWVTAEGRLRGVLDAAPGNLAATAGLAMLMQSVGRLRESSALGAELVEREPLSPIYQYRRAYNLWNGGRLAEADRTIDAALQLWPRHPSVWGTRLLLFAYTDRAAAALAMLDDADGRPPRFDAAAQAMWRASATALASGAPADVASARAASLAAAARDPGGAVHAVMTLSRLGELDAAFAVAEGYLLRRGPLIGALRAPAGGWVLNDQRRRKTMMLFIPATAALRADQRFVPLCEAMGLADYWREAGVRPDFLRARLDRA